MAEQLSTRSSGHSIASVQDTRSMYCLLINGKTARCMFVIQRTCKWLDLTHIGVFVDKGCKFGGKYNSYYDSGFTIIVFIQIQPQQSYCQYVSPYLFNILPHSSCHFWVTTCCSHVEEYTVPLQRKNTLCPVTFLMFAATFALSFAELRMCGRPWLIASKSTKSSWLPDIVNAHRGACESACYAWHKHMFE